MGSYGPESFLVMYVTITALHNQLNINIAAEKSVKQ